MAKIPQQDLEDLILNGNRHTYPALCATYATDETNKMQIDRTLQKLRRKGKLKFRREGRNIIWQSVTEQPKGGI